MADNEIGRILLRSELKQILARCRKEKKVIVATNGCFDILHIGHLHLINQAKALGDILVIGVNSDRSVKKLKGPQRPVVTEKERAEILANLRAIDFVTIFDEDTAAEFLKAIEPDIYVKGGDYSLESLPEAQAVASFGGKVQFIDLAPGKSSTDLLVKIKALS